MKVRKKSRSQLLHQYYKYTGFYSFIWQGVKSAVLPTAAIVGILFYVNYIVINLNEALLYLTQNFSDIFIFSVFLASETILGIIFSPLMWLIGIAKEDMMLMGQLLGIKLAASEFVGYIQLAELKNVANEVHFTFNKSVIMATYMLCGFANFASIGIQIGGIGSPIKRIIRL
jgi:nucleoside permease NupC